MVTVVSKPNVEATAGISFAIAVLLSTHAAQAQCSPMSLSRFRIITGVTRRAPVVALLCLLLALSAAAEAQDGQWRLFTSDDGLPETWVHQVAPGKSGRVWTRHGIPGLASFDGYRVRLIDGPPNQPLSEDPSGRLWSMMAQPDTVQAAGIECFEDGRWRPFPIPEIAGTLLTTTRILAWADNRVLVLTPDRLIEVNGATGNRRLIRARDDRGAGAFVALRPTEDGGAWIGATRVLGRLAPPRDWAAGPSAWAELTLPAGLGNVSWAIDAPGGTLVVARHVGGESTSVLRRVGTAWQSVATSTADEPLIAAWDGVDRRVWLLRANASAFGLATLDEDGVERRVPRSRALSGTVFDVLPGPGGGFWLATSLGLVRYLPAAWRSPAALTSRAVHTGSIGQVPSGDLLVLQGGVLLQRTGTRWNVHPLPAGVRANVYNPHVLGMVGRDRVAVGIMGPNPPLLFDLATGLFVPLRHPEQREIDIIGTRRAGGVWAITRLGESPARLESYDGQTFAVRLTLDGTWLGDGRPRLALETRQSDLILTPAPQGVAWIHGDTVRWLNATPAKPGPAPFTAAELDDGRIWFGGRDGVTAFDGERLTLVRSGLQTVRSIIQARDRSVWVGSNSGVHRFVEGSWIPMTNQEGLPDAAVFALFEDRAGQIWASTTAGLSRHFVDADRDAPDTVLPPDRNPTQAAPSGDMLLAFTAMDRWRHTLTGRLLYSNRLDNGAWSAFDGAISVSLEQLSAGDHTFDVRAMDRSGNIDTSPATMRFRVLLPWYREPGVLGLGAAGLLALALAVSLFLTRHMRLERLVHARTAQLRDELTERQRVEQERARLEAQLMQSQKMEALGRLAGGISHDFNNLLTVICSYGDLLKDELDVSDPRREHAEEIAKAGSRAAALTQQLLAFSRHQAVERLVIDLNATLTDLMRMLARLLGERIDLRFIPGASLWPVLADPGQIEQVVVNLAVNARDAMPDGGRLTIETGNVVLDATYVEQHVEARPGPHVRLEIGDTGIGIDAETRTRIFEPFFTTKPSGKGSGLGLATVYGIVHQSGGHIVVESAPQQGTRFVVYLPRTDARPTPQKTPPPAVAAWHADAVLLVEDEDAVRLLAATVLRRLGHRVIEATSGDEALRLLDGQSFRPDLLVSDVVMPGISGPELSRRLRARWPDLLVLLMSGYANDIPIIESHDSRSAFLQKPFTPGALGDQVQSLLMRRRNSTSPGEQRFDS